jgi:hypothetical protein
MIDVIHDLEGESFVNNNAEVVYKFENLDLELAEVDRLRSKKRDDSQLGDVIFESK